MLISRTPGRSSASRAPIGTPSIVGVSAVCALPATTSVRIPAAWAPKNALGHRRLAAGPADLVHPVEQCQRLQSLGLEPLAQQRKGS